eukprot:TRINITY_DN3437_c0_g1_i8.p1 TRINITY_DN3437_c0_g1~~TRINITY_DN3437_c0_g1_i8.p1  ORF type:complete len:153 (-),score=25.34 TRINITY_DN3437_c0_g1_i8:337-795(-)
MDQIHPTPSTPPAPPSTTSLLRLQRPHHQRRSEEVLQIRQPDLQDLGGTVQGDFVISNQAYYHYTYESPGTVSIYQYFFDTFHYELLFSVGASTSWTVSIARDEKNLKSYHGISLGGATRLYQYDEVTKKVDDLGAGLDKSPLFSVALDGKV